MLRFEEEDHKYYWNETEIPSVTTVLKHVGVLEDRFFPLGAATLGKTIHSMTEMVDKGAVSAKLTNIPRLNAYVDFVETVKPVYKKTEAAMYDKARRVAGTVDRVAEIDDKTYVLDIKTGQSLYWHGIQLAAYASMANVANICCLYLKPDGKWKLKKYDYYDELSKWSSCVVVYDLISGRRR